MLRQAVGVEGRRGGARFSAAVVELGRALVCTSFGTEQVGAGWPRAAAGAALEELLERGEAVGEAGSYRPRA